MADKKPDPLKERISALPEEPRTRPRLGFGGLPIPPKPQTLPVASSPVHEDTKVGVAPPAPLSAPQPPSKRSLSPKPAELAPTPASRGAAQAAALSAVADQDRRQAEELAAMRAELEAARRASKPTDYKGIALVLTAVGGIVATIVAGSCSASVPPGVLECPDRLDDLERRIRKVTATADDAETDLAQAKREWRKTDEKAEDALGEVAKLRKFVPRVEGLKPDP